MAFGGAARPFLGIHLFIITYGAMLGKEWGGMGQNYLKPLFTLGF